MATPFTDWELKDARDAISASIEEMVGSQAAFDTNAAFIEDHDHWQDGKGWVGPNGGGDLAVQTKVLAAVQRQFTPRDALNEILDRMANALLKREPDIDFIPLEPIPDPEIPDGADQETIDRLRAEVEQKREEQRLVTDAMKSAIAQWWDAKKLWPLARKVAKRSRWAGRGGLRTWIAPGNLEEVRAEQVATEGAAESEDGDEARETAAPSLVRLPTGLDFLDALMRVELSAPRPDATRVHVDQETQQKVGIFTYRDDDAAADKAELWFVDGDKTVLRVVSDGGEGDREFPVDLGKRLPIAEMEAELLVTEPARRLQNRLNFHESVLVRVGEVAGFPERYTLNAEPGGIWLDTPPAGSPPLQSQVINGKTWYLTPAPRTLGAAVTTELVGIRMKTGQGEERATPGVVFKEPTDPDYAIKASEHAYYALLKQCKQGHLATQSTAEASGVAYEQSRADYEDDLEAVAGPLSGMLREIIEVAIAWGEAMSEKQASGASFLDRFRVSVTMHVCAGPITPAAQLQNNANVEAGTLSRASAMAASGIEDVQAELEKIMGDPAALVDLRSSQATAITTLVAEGMSWEDAGRFVGIDDPDLLRLLKQADDAAAEREAQARTQADAIAAATGQGDSIDQILTGTKKKAPAPPPAAAAAAGAGA